MPKTYFSPGERIKVNNNTTFEGSESMDYKFAGLVGKVEKSGHNLLSVIFDKKDFSGNNITGLIWKWNCTKEKKDSAAKTSKKRTKR